MQTIPMPAADIASLVEALGDAPRVTYAPPNIYPMSAPRFETSTGAERSPERDGPLGVYAHVPFCRYKCTFCFYVTRPVPQQTAEMVRYVEAVERELTWIRPGTPLTQLYVGGGTPTALPAELLDRLLGAIFARVDAGRELHTVECSPDSVTDEHVRVLLRHGIGRVSMGVQSTDEGVRNHINRSHANTQVVEAIERLVAAGLMVNVDLIYGLPEQTPQSFRDDFALAARHGAHSVTSYNLRVNENTPIGRLVSDQGRLDAVALVRWREQARGIAEEMGFQQTRWHTYQRVAPKTAVEAAARFRDVTGWGDQFGAGVSARSRLSDTVYRNEDRVPDYLDRIEGGRSPVGSVQMLTEGERRLRFVTLTLGDGRALTRSDYAEAFRAHVDDDFGTTLSRLAAAGVVEDDGERIALTDRGKLVYDLATRAFYPPNVRHWMDERQKLVGEVVNLRPRARAQAPRSQ